MAGRFVAEKPWTTGQAGAVGERRSTALKRILGGLPQMREIVMHFESLFEPLNRELSSIQRCILKDKKRLLAIAKRGDEHAKLLRTHVEILEIGIEQAKAKLGGELPAGFLEQIGWDQLSQTSADLGPPACRPLLCGWHAPSALHLLEEQEIPQDGLATKFHSAPARWW